MTPQAQVTSVEAIESFRANLLVYLSKARPVLEEISADVLRMKQWLQHDQRRHWEGELRLRQRRLDEAKAELFSAKISAGQKATTLPLMTMQRAQQAVKEAEAKLAILSRWEREIDNRTDPLVKQIEQLHGFLTTDMTKAVMYLAQVVKTLDAYTEVLPPTGSAVSTSEPTSDSTKATQTSGEPEQ